MNIKLSKAPRLWFVKAFPTNLKKRTLVQRMRTWRKSLKKSCYKMDGQIAMW
ncbi:hypothetical protein ACFL3C_05310 [Patescibacteria group bacterium]